MFPIHYWGFLVLKWKLQKKLNQQFLKIRQAELPAYDLILKFWFHRRFIQILCFNTEAFCKAWRHARKAASTVPQNQLKTSTGASNGDLQLYHREKTFMVTERCGTSPRRLGNVFWYYSHFESPSQWHMAKILRRNLKQRHLLYVPPIS